MQVLKISNITNCNFGKKIRISNDEKRIDMKNTLTQTVNIGKELAVPSSRFAATVFSLESSGLDCLELAPEIAESVRSSAPLSANFSVLHPSLTSSGLLYSAKSIDNKLNLDSIFGIEKELPSDNEENN